ncbi:MAG TPA: histidinol-phosphate transaminase [Steroidobacteraceae bacterium]|nr:histidinol-phosphate transaminase [Steroidobacteraceae bacterium]
MSISRRRFLASTSASALAAPVLLNGRINSSVAATAAAPSAAGEFDLSMGFPEGALRLGFNENPLGPSQKAIAGAIAAIPGSYRYALSWELRPLIAKHHEVDKEWVLIGNGSTEVLTLVPAAFARETNANVVAALETWDEMLTVAENMGTRVKRIRLLKDKSYAYDVDGMLAAVDADTRVFMIISPNNPTGSALDYAQLKKIADALPKKVLFVIDQAYADYLPDGKTGIDLVREGHRNVLVTRTFSKAHAMAGLRCGYGIAHPDILKEIARFGCGPGSTNMAVFGAVEGSLRDPAHIERSRAWVRSSHAWYQQQCAGSSLELVAGVSPFALIAVGAGRGKAVQNGLRARKVFINDGARWHLPDYIRVSYGLEKENQAFFNELTALMQRKA